MWYIVRILEATAVRNFEFYLIGEVCLEVGLLPFTLNELFGSEVQLTQKGAWIKPCHSKPEKNVTGQGGYVFLRESVCIHYLPGKLEATREC